MSLLVGDIVDLNLLEGARMVAGMRGAQNAIRWVNVMEILDMPGSVQEHELLVTTGFQMDDEKRHQQLIASLKAQGACGIAIQPGYYIPAIPQYILDDAERLNFPVIELPKNMTFSHITHVLLDSIRSREQAQYSPDLTSLAKVLEGWEKRVAPFGQSRLPDGGRIIFWLLPSSENGSITADVFKMAVSKIKMCIQPKCQKVTAHTQGQGVLIFAQGLNGDDYAEIALDLGSLLHELGRSGIINLICGFSAPPYGQSLDAGLTEAVKAAEVLAKIGAYRGLCPYHSIGLYEMTEAIQRNRPGGNAPAGPLQKILAYDREHNTALGKTLRAYLLSEGNLCASAERLYIHRHTLKNRLLKIEQLCGMRLSDHHARLYLSMELMLHDLFTP